MNSILSPGAKGTHKATTYRGAESPHATDTMNSARSSDAKGSHTATKLRIAISSNLAAFYDTLVCIRLVSSPDVPTIVYNHPKDLLCKHSEYFRAAFNNGFAETTSRVLEITELEGVISGPALEVLINWLYTSHVYFADDVQPAQIITELLMCAKMAEYFIMDEVFETYLAAEIRGTIMENGGEWLARPHTQFLTRAHIESAARLRRGNPVRDVVAATSVADRMCSMGHMSRFSMSRDPSLFESLEEDVDLMYQIAMMSSRCEGMFWRFLDPITGNMEICARAWEA